MEYHHSMLTAELEINFRALWDPLWLNESLAASLRVGFCDEKMEKSLYASKYFDAICSFRVEKVFCHGKYSSYCNKENYR